MDPLLHRELNCRIIRYFRYPRSPQADDIAGSSGHELALIGGRPHLVAFLNPLEYPAICPGTYPFPLHMEGVITVLLGCPEVAVGFAGDGDASVLNLKHRLF